MKTFVEHRGSSRPMPSDGEAILNALPNPVLLIAPDGKIVDANIAAESFFEISTQFLRRQPPCDFCGADLTHPGDPVFHRIERILDIADRGPAAEHRRPQRVLVRQHADAEAGLSSLWHRS